jgi:hypothetical protein
MSGQEEQQPQIQQQQGGDASVVMPIARSSLLDFLYISGVPILPYYGGGGGVVGGGLGSQNVEMEQVVASILAGSLYERNPVKKVFDEEAETCEIIDKKFTGTLVEEMKINSACGIWQEDFEEGEDIKILPCNHAFKSQAIMKWLKEEKAECPMCRFALKSKELLCRENEERNDYDDDDDVDNEEAAAPQPQHEPDPDPERNNHAIRINNIASRIVQSVAGRVSHYEESISVPINRLIENRRNLISQARNVAAARAAIPSSVGAAAVSYANAHREVRAEAIQHAAAPVNNNLNNNNPNYNIINNNFYYYDNNNYNNNNYNNNNYDEDFMLNQEQADIEEAIRRSLEHI